MAFYTGLGTPPKLSVYHGPALKLVGDLAWFDGMGL